MILTLIDHEQGPLNVQTLEALTLARGLAEETAVPLHAIVVGTAAGPLLSQLSAYGVTVVYDPQHEALTDYAPAAWAQAVVQVAAEVHPQTVLAPGTERGNEVMAHVAARLNLPLATNCTAVSPGDSYLVTRIRWGGSLLEEARLSGSPKLLTVAPLVIVPEEAAAPATPEVKSLVLALKDADLVVRVMAREAPQSDKVTLAEARVVVGGGRGVGSAEGFAVLEELAGLLEGAVGGSRVATNLGWRPHADQIGQTGTRIAPDLYIACGISGAIQHWVGCKGAKQILAINTDPDAPVMGKADYAVIGDLHEIVPALVAEIRRLTD